MEKSSRKLAKCSHVHQSSHTFTLDSRAWILSSPITTPVLKAHNVSQSQKSQHRVRYHRNILFSFFQFRREACLILLQIQVFSELSGLGELKTLLAVVFHFGHSKSFSHYIWNRSLVVFCLGSRTCDPSAAWLFIMTYGHFPLPFNSSVVGNKFKPSPPRFYLFLLLKGLKVCGVQKEEATTVASKPKDFNRELSWRQVYAMDSLHPCPSPWFLQLICAMASLLRLSRRGLPPMTMGAREAGIRWHQTYWQ